MTKFVIPFDPVRATREAFVERSLGNDDLCAHCKFSLKPHGLRERGGLDSTLCAACERALDDASEAGHA